VAIYYAQHLQTATILRKEKNLLGLLHIFRIKDQHQLAGIPANLLCFAFPRKKGLICAHRGLYVRNDVVVVVVGCWNMMEDERLIDGWRVALQIQKKKCIYLFVLILAIQILF